MPLKIPETAATYIVQLERSGANDRYLMGSHRAGEDEMFCLDHCVWHLRRYCEDFGLRPRLLAYVESERFEEHPEELKLFGGCLESILKRPHQDDARRALVWQNFYYGARRKPRVIKHRPRIAGFEVSALVRWKELPGYLQGKVIGLGKQASSKKRKSRRRDENRQ